MKEFFLILFLGKSLVLTPMPIDLADEVTLELGAPVSAVTSGAHLRIDVTRSVPSSIDLADVVDVLDYLAGQFPAGSVTATLTSDTGAAQVLDEIGGSSDGKTAELIVSSAAGVPTGIDFSRLKIVTTVPLTAVTVTWQNYKK